MSQIKVKSDFFPMARVYLNDKDAIYPGWYLQRYVSGELMTSRLHVDDAAEAFEAVGAAAQAIGCIPEQIQVGGAPWPPSQQVS